MTRIVKLNNGANTDRIENYFKESITLEPFSKIGLLNCSLQVEERFIQITDDMLNSLTFQTTAGNNATLGTAQLVAGNYNMSEFLEMLNKAMNAGLTFNTTTNGGFQWKVLLTQENRLKFIFNRLLVPNSGDHPDFIPKFMNGLTQNPAGTFTKNLADDAWNAGSVSSLFFGSGASAIFLTRPATKDWDILVGLVSSNDEAYFKPDGVNFDFSDLQCEYAIYSKIATVGNNPRPHVYFIKYKDEDGVEIIEETAVQPGAHHIGMMLSKGKLKFFYKASNLSPPTDNAQTIVLKEIPWLFNENLYGMFSIYNGNVAITNPKFYYDPFHHKSGDNEHYYLDEPTYNISQESDVNNQLGASTRATHVKIIFNDTDTARFFGFSSRIPPRSASVVSGTILADNPLPNYHLPDNMKVILDSYPLESYDGVLQKRQSILMTIPALYYEGAKIIFNKENPLMLDLNNQHAITLNNVKLRFLTFDNQSITLVENLADATLLISK